MPSEDVLPFSELLAPIRADKPTGDDLRANQAPDSDYRAIRRARDTAGEAERRIDRGDADVDPPLWAPVVTLGIGVIATKSKDLDIAAYLIEGLVRVHGFAGFRDGFRLARMLIETYWDGLYPAGTGSDVSERFSKLIYLNGIEKEGTLIVPVRKIPFTSPATSPRFSLASYLQARSTGKMDEIKKAVAEAEEGYYPTLLEDIEQAKQEFLGFCEALKQKSKYDPPSSFLLGLLQSYLDTVKDLARDKIPKPSSPEAVASTTNQGAPSGSTTPAPQPAPAGTIRSRDDALQQLRKVAEFFREHEPQSIIPFALEQVIKWGNMSLPELLAELIPDEGPRKNLFKQIGIRPPGS